jgi:hypothetical protein
MTIIISNPNRKTRHTKWLNSALSPFLPSYNEDTIAASLRQGILQGEVSLYHWPPVWLVWNPLYDNWQFLFLFPKHTNPNQSNRRSMVQWYFPLQYSLFEAMSWPLQKGNSVQVDLLKTWLYISRIINNRFSDWDNKYLKKYQLHCL